MLDEGNAMIAGYRCIFMTGEGSRKQALSDNESVEVMVSADAATSEGFFQF